MNKARIYLCACLCVLAVLTGPAKGDVIQVSIKDPNIAWTLSDLIVYGDPNDPNEKKVFLAPNDPNDDIDFSPRMTRTFDADFKITSYVSSTGGTDPKGNYWEWETMFFNVRTVVPKKVAVIGPGPYIQEQLRLVLAVDQAVAPEPPPVGTILAFVEGYNELMPGWFVGTDINFDTGEVTGAYTGNVEVFSIPFEVLVFTAPYPPDGAVGLRLDDDLFWPKSERAESYEVYFGTNFDDVKRGRGGTFKGSQSATTYDPGTLEPCRTYYWKIDGCFSEVEEVEVGEFIIIEEHEVRDEGPLWSFTTGPMKATNPYPVDGATDVDPNAILSWTPGCLAAFEDVYFGADFYAVANADTSDTTGIYRGRLATDSYNPGTLEPGTTYYWKVDEVEADGTTKHTGEVWSFTTQDTLVPVPIGIPTQWNIDFQGDENHNNTYGQTDPVAYVGPYLQEQLKDYWNIFEVPALSAPWPGPTNYVTNPSMDLADNDGNFGVDKSSIVKFSIIGDAYGWAGDAGDDPLTGDYLIILNGFGVTNDPLTWRITGLAPSTTYRLTYYHRDNVLGRGINFVANGVETTVSVPGLSVASALVTTDWGRRITGTADSDGYAEGNWSALTIATVADIAANPHPPDGATDVPLDVVLSWTPADYAVTHDVYFGTSSPPPFIVNQTASRYYYPYGLEPGTTYYWKVDEVEADGATTGGDVWSFTTADYTPFIVDDFESYPSGTFPSAGGWEIVWAGTGENYVTDACSFSPTKSLQLWGRPSWASVAQRKFSTDAPVIGYEFAIRIDSIGTGGPGRVEHPGFFSREAYIWGAYYARVIFNHDTGKIEGEDGTILGNWEPGVWYQVKVVLDRSTNTYKVWIDGQLKGEGLTTSRPDTDLIDALALISAHPGVKVYYDDVSIF